MTGWEIVCGTGHRELADDGGEDEDWAREQLGRCAVWLRDRAGTRAGISGMARGFDLWWADALAAAGVPLWAYIPFEEQPARWNRADQATWRLLRTAAAKVRVLGALDPTIPAKQRSAAVNRLLHARNDAMLRDAGAVVAVWEPGRLDGGTHSALTKAARRRMPGVHLDPVAHGITFELPGLDRLVKHALYHQGCGCVAGVGVRAEVEQRRAALQTAGYHQWRVRAARPRETGGQGCATCRVDLPRAAIARPLERS